MSSEKTMATTYNSTQVFRAFGPPGFAKHTTLWYASPVRESLCAIRKILENNMTKALFMIMFIFLNMEIFAIEIDINQGIVISDMAKVYELPNKTSKVVCTLKKNELFIVKEVERNQTIGNNYYVEIEKEGKIIGWIFRNDVGINTYSDILNSEIKDDSFRNYYNSINNEDCRIWFVVTYYEFDQFFYGIVLSTNKMSLMIDLLSKDTKIKVFEYQDINSDGIKEVIIETSWEAMTDPTQGSTLNIFGLNNGEISNLFDLNTSYVSHAFTIYMNSILIKNNELLVEKIYLGEAEYHENGPKTFGVFWTIPLKKKTERYIWNSTKYILIEERNNITIKCKSTIDSLRLRERPSLNAKVIRLIQEDEEFTVLEITGGYPGEKEELIPGTYGFWVKIVGNDGIAGWSYSYYFDFYSEYINSYMKYEGERINPSKYFTEVKYIDVDI
jgi:hypothetical protein